MAAVMEGEEPLEADEGTRQAIARYRDARHFSRRPVVAISLMLTSSRSAGTSQQ